MKDNVENQQSTYDSCLKSSDRKSQANNKTSKNERDTGDNIQVRLEKIELIFKEVKELWLALTTLVMLECKVSIALIKRIMLLQCVKILLYGLLYISITIYIPIVIASHFGQIYLGALISMLIQALAIWFIDWVIVKLKGEIGLKESIKMIRELMNDLKNASG